MNVTVWPIRFWLWMWKNKHNKAPDLMTEPLWQSFRVLPTDVDINMHLNNARYLRFMEMGRWSLLARNKILKKAFKKKYAGIVAGINMRYRRSIKPFEHFQLVTQIYDWDEKWFYLRQFFINSKDQISAVGYVRIVFLKNGRAVKSQQFIDDFQLKLQKADPDTTFTELITANDELIHRYKS